MPPPPITLTPADVVKPTHATEKRPPLPELPLLRHTALTGATNAGEILVQTLEQAIDAVVVIDEHNRVVFFNAAAERLWGWGNREVIGRSVTMLVPADIQPRHDELIERNRRTNESHIVGSSRKVRLERKDGRALWATLSLSRITVDRRVMYTAFLRDVTREHEDQEQLRLLSLGTDATGNAVIITDDEHRIVFINAGFRRLFGHDAEEACGRRPGELLAGAHTEAASLARLDGQQHRGETFRADEIVYRKDGRPLWASLVMDPIHREDGSLRNCVIALTEITRSKMYELLQRSVLETMIQDRPVREVMDTVCRKVESIAPELRVAILVASDDSKYLRLLAAPSVPEVFRPVLHQLPIAPDSASSGTAAWYGTSVEASSVASSPAWAPYRELAAAAGIAACWAHPIKARNGRVLGTLACYFVDQRRPDDLHRQLVELCAPLCAVAIEREAAKIHIERLAFYDALTGLPNRRLLLAQASRALALCARHGTPLAMLFIDLDRFKQVNDTLGHDSGDALLREIAQRLQECVRDADLVGRLSGDEFAIVLPQTNAEQACAAVERLLASLARPLQVAGARLNPSASIGVSLFPDNGCDVDTLLRHADVAMYQAKAAGRNAYEFFSPEMNRYAHERMALEAALRDALSGGGLYLHYQPQLRLDDNRLYGVEALARWRDPHFGDVPPSHFIPLAEECGLIVELGRVVLDEACRQLADWRRRGVPIPSVSLNLSSPHFRDPTLPALIADTLARHCLTPRDITLEATESMVMDAHPITQENVAAIHAAGVHLALDDFGTGYSSLGYLRSLPVSELKLDRSFIRDLGRDDKTGALVDAVIRMGESLNLTVVAEGIERQEQARFLARHGCHIGQGYLYARPLAPDTLEQWLAGR
ncbi:EAL domain-containing protein [Azoarcus indigens]|uniref:PAS domain S-box-containing protein/diguanylate cyclase (GGDEF)-like protein n=1 Tax=Azoarcus indigens TaxID=29545 RepID=A0A4V3BMA9_9RHOO|nr:EAL domain-containing protein [Azoarcus indigens]NMG67204.1 EAL domain-containing protein [Azoarcus indigens]TDN49942.1 PAS domain S-box-containing protein/diguanylate cyclase (GGDEF)-like protein [Azoarcus indigens]